MDRDIFMVQESLQNCEVTRVDITTGIFTCPRLLYSSDADDEDNLQLHARVQDNLQEAAVDQGPGAHIEPFQSLEQIFNPQFDQNADLVRRIMALSNERNPLLKDDDVALPERLSNVEWIEFLVKKGPAIVAAALENPVRTSRILRKLGGEIQVLRPGNSADGDLGDWRDRSQWRRQLSALASELMMVEDGCSPEVRDAGVFVLSKFQYASLLELMAQEILEQK